MTEIRHATDPLRDIGLKIERLWTALQHANTSVEKRTAIFHEADRFRLWALNLGLYATGHASLFYRLREVDTVRTVIESLLQDFKSMLIEISRRLSIELPADELQAISSELLEGPLDVEDECGDDYADEGEDEVQLCIQEAADILDRLFRIASKLRSPATRTVSLKALKFQLPDPVTGVDLFDQYTTFDQGYVKDMFRHNGIDLDTVDVTYLVDRMSRAITTRRRILAHRKRHRSKMAHATRASQTQPNVEPRQNKQDVTHHVQIPQQAVSAAGLSNPTTATFLDPSKAVLDAKSNVSESVYAPTARGTNNEAIEVPPPPDIGNDRYFECPYCFFLCSKEYTRHKSWRHVLHDLQPYVCTYPNCVEGDRLFDSRQDWVNHENSSHRRIWRCIYHVNLTFEGAMSYRQHLEEYHEMRNGDPSIDTLVHAGVSSMTQSDRPCPFCYTEYENINDMHLHVAYHLERFSIFALPRSHHLDKDEDMNDGEAGSNDANTQRDQSLDEGDSTEKSSLAFESQPSRNESSAAHSVTAEGLRTDTHATDDQRELPTTNVSARGVIYNFAHQTAEAEAVTKGSHQKLGISQLTEVQQSALQTYTSVTDQEILAAIPVLQRAKWNVSIAISRFFNGESASDSPAEAVEVLQGTEGEERPDALSTMADLASTYLNQGRAAEAEELQVQVINARMRALGQEHPDTLSSMHSLAMILHNQGKHEQAEEICRQALGLREKVLGQEHPDTLTSMSNLAMILRYQGKYEQAEEIYRQTFELRKKVLGQEHPGTLSSMQSLAMILHDQGEYEQAEVIYRQTLELKEKVLGQEHPGTLNSMQSLAMMLHDQGKYEQAEEIYRQTLELKEKALGQEHPGTLNSMHSLAMILHDQGKYEQAEEIYRQTLKLREKVLGQEHPDTLSSMDNLAVILRDQGKYEQAEEICRQNLKLREEVLGQEHPDTLNSMYDLAMILRYQGKYEQAEAIYRQTLELREKVLGQDHPDILSGMDNLAMILRDQGKHEQAEVIYRQTLELREKVLGKDHPDTLMSMNNLVFALGDQGKYEQAEEMHRQGTQAEGDGTGQSASIHNDEYKKPSRNT